MTSNAHSNIRRFVLRAVSALGLAGLLTLAVPTPEVSAAPICPHVKAAAAINVGQLPGWVESIIIDKKGRMFASDFVTQKVYRIDYPGAMPVALANVLASGIVVRPDGKLLVGTGNSPDAIILLIDPDSGQSSVYARGLMSIDGIALAPDGTVYTSTFAGTDIGRVTPNGSVDPHWANVLSPNGIAVSADGRYLYAIQTFISPTLYRIPTDNPRAVEPWVASAPHDALAIPDGLTLDSRGRPLVATNIPGQVWRVENDQFCSVSDQSDRFLTTQVTYGHGATGFSAGKLYRTGELGSIEEIPGGFDPSGI